MSIIKPDNWEEVAAAYIKGDMDNKEACSLLYVSVATFYKWLNADYPNRKYKHRGNKTKAKPSNWHEVADKFIKRELDYAEASEQLEISEGLFYKWLEQDYPNRDKTSHRQPNVIRPNNYAKVIEKYLRNEIRRAEDVRRLLGVSHPLMNRWVREDYGNTLSMVRKERNK